MRLVLLATILGLLATTNAWAKPAIWIVRDADSEMVLFGSIHVLPPDLAWRPPALDAAVSQADDLWFELPVGTEADQETSRLVAQRGVLPPEQSLFRLLAHRDAARLARMADLLGVDKATLDRFEPWLAEVALAAAVYNKAGASGAYGVEHILDAAAPRRVRREALETADEQIALFDEAPFKDQLASLRQSVAELETDPQGYDDLLRAWQAGDPKTLETEVLAPLRKASPKLFKRLVSERNARWATRLDERLRGQGRTVVVVGAGHLIGKEGVPARLRALGYSVSGP